MNTTHDHWNRELCERLRSRLLSSEFATDKTKINDRYINNLRCPACGEVEAYAYSDRPFAIICNRKNHCGAKTPTRELFPDVMRRVEEEYPATKEDPERPARAYLEGRGLKKSLVGLKYRHMDYTREGCGGGVGFPLGKLDEKGEGTLREPPVFNARIYNPPDGDKTHNTDKLDDNYWFHPGLKYNLEERLFITEGVINALSLIEIGLPAVAVLSSSRAPSRFPFTGFKRMVLAFDNDPAGGDAFKRWKEVFPNAEAMTPDRGDWNDFLCAADSAEEAKAEFDKEEKQFRGLAGLLLAPTAANYAERYLALYQDPPGLFEFGGSIYDSGQTAQGQLYTRQVGNFNLCVDHFRLDTHNPDQPEYRYRLKVTRKGHRPVSFTVAGNELSNPDGLTKTFLTHGKVLWEGDRKASMTLTRRIVESKAPEVRQLDRIGYDPESEWCAFRDFAINPDGKLLVPSKHGFYQLGRLRAFRPAPFACQLKPEPGMSAREIYRLICDAWEIRAAVGIAFMVGSWFVVQIKDAIGFYPFLSMNGENTAGKTYLVTAMNAVQCLDEEGLPMFKENTGKGELRKLGQISGLFRAMLEGNAGAAIRFDYGKILPLYNKNPLQIRAVRSNDNQTVEMLFLGALIFVQNAEPFKTPAQKSRFISEKFTQADIEDTVDAFNRVQALRKEQLANFYVEVMGHRKMIEAEWLKRYQEIEKSMAGEILQPRIRQNHALILAFHGLVSDITGVSVDLRPHMIDLAKAKVQDCLERMETLADYFFDALDHLPEGKKAEAVYTDDGNGRMQVLLPHALRLLKENDLFNGQPDKLQSDLQAHPAFISSRHSSRRFSQITGEDVMRVWLFDLAKLERTTGVTDDVDEAGGEGEEPIEPVDEGASQIPF